MERKVIIFISKDFLLCQKSESEVVSVVISVTIVKSVGSMVQTVPLVVV